MGPTVRSYLKIQKEIMNKQTDWGLGVAQQQHLLQAGLPSTEN